MQKIPLSVRLRAIFTRDKDSFWWHYFTDEELELRSMDVWQLAKVINEARVRNLAGDSEKLIVAEHMLNVRLAQIQAKASWGAGLLGFLGAITGAALSVAVTLAVQVPMEASVSPERESESSPTVLTGDVVENVQGE